MNNIVKREDGSVEMELSKHVVLAYNPNTDIYTLCDNTPYMYDCRKNYEIEFGSDILDQLYNKAWHDTEE